MQQRELNRSKRQQSKFIMNRMKKSEDLQKVLDVRDRKQNVPVIWAHCACKRIQLGSKMVQKLQHDVDMKLFWKILLSLTISMSALVNL